MLHNILHLVFQEQESGVDGFKTLKKVIENRCWIATIAEVF